MQRTLRTRRLPARGARRGEVALLTGFTDPEYGWVRCDAAPLLAADLAARQVPAAVRTAALDGAADGILFTVSYLDRRGVAGGFALMAHQDDAARIVAAQEAATRWRALLRSRRLLVADVPALCWGGRRALRLIKEPAVSLGQPAGAAEMASVADLDLMPDDATIALPAHGATLAARAEIAARGIRVIDATCPLVAAAQADAAARAADSDLVVVIGDAEHAATSVLAEHAGDSAVIVSCPEEVAGLACRWSSRVSFVIEPGMSAERAMPVLRALRARFPRLHGHHLDALCDATSDREQTIASVAAASELVLVLGADERITGTPVRVITRLSDLDPSLLNDVTVVGLVTGLSADPALSREVIASVSGLGPLSVRRRGTRTRGYPVHEPASPSDTVRSVPDSG
jgi:4-hydroxy-3-methylbut-2-enyl diphosphate reductase